MSDDRPLETCEGYLLFLPWAQGSKSESLQPFLVQGPSLIRRVILTGENPFDHEVTQSLHGCWCRLECTAIGPGELRAQTAVAVPDPYRSSDAGNGG